MLEGRIETLRVESSQLRGNPLGDPHVRELPVYLPPGSDGRDLPLIFSLAGFGGTGAGHLVGTPWDPPLPERFERLLATGDAAPAVIAFPDAFTRLGGSQYVNSSANGPYRDYVTEELLPLVEERFGAGGRRERRGLLGKSSGGFGALHLSFERPELFGALASHSGDADFEWVYRPEFPKLMDQIARHGGVEAFLQAFESSPRKSAEQFDAINVLAMAAAYSPSPDRPLGIELPFEVDTGRLRPDVWARWKAFDPVEVARARGEALADFHLVFLDCGRRDEYHLQYGTRQLRDALRDTGVAVHHEEFDDGHRGISYRYDASLPLLTRALSC